MAMTSVNPLGTVLWPAPFAPQATTVPSDLSAKTVSHSRGDGDDAAQTAWHHALTGTVVAPRHDRAVGFKGQTVLVSRSDSDDTAQPARHRALANTVLSPRDDQAVRFKRQIVIPSRSNSREGSAGLNQGQHLAAPS